MTLKLTCESCGREFFVQAEEAWTYEIPSSDGIFRGYECRSCADLFTRSTAARPCSVCGGRGYATGCGGNDGYEGPCHTP
jgi:hypothetical protein